MTAKTPFNTYAVKRGKSSGGPLSSNLPRPTMTIHFADHGQDFLEWDLDANGIVVACRPFQEQAWKGYKVFEPEKLEPGHPVRCLPTSGEGTAVIKYPVERMETYK